MKTIPIFLDTNFDKRVGHAYTENGKWVFNLNQYHNEKDYSLIPVTCDGKIIAWSAKRKVANP